MLLLTELGDVQARLDHLRAGVRSCESASDSRLAPTRRAGAGHRRRWVGRRKDAAGDPRAAGGTNAPAPSHGSPRHTQPVPFPPAPVFPPPGENCHPHRVSGCRTGSRRGRNQLADSPDDKRLGALPLCRGPCHGAGAGREEARRGP
jgi:hypothetical protein